MTHYIIQTIAFQLLFLVVYDLFLKRETFFNLNRIYLLITPLLSLFLPFIRLESLKDVAPAEYIYVIPEVITAAVTPAVESEAWYMQFSATQWLFITGGVVSLLIFIYKLSKIAVLKKKGRVKWFRNYTEVEVSQSEIAFSFFKNIFIGDVVKEKDHDHIIRHELVHIAQWHSLDLMLFELLRIVFWFNPLIYIYQSRISELHEFIADAKTSGENKREQYQQLLSEVFKTENISFINQFFNHSLIKKRIVMLQRSRSKKIWQLKYLLLLPVVTGILVYTSCAKEKQGAVDSSAEEVIEVVGTDGKLNNNNKEEEVPFTLSFTKPSFPGCENAENEFDCFKSALNKHIIENFRYPEIAQENNIQGRVDIQFRINKDGSVTVMQTRGPDPSLDNEAKRLINSLPKLNPGKNADGDPVAVTFAYPIVFKLSDDIDRSANKTNLPKDTDDNSGLLTVNTYKDPSNPEGIISGKILSKEKGALPGVNILIKGANRAAVTDFDGNFRIKAGKGDIIVLLYKGLLSTEIEVTDGNAFNVITK